MHQRDRQSIVRVGSFDQEVRALARNLHPHRGRASTRQLSFRNHPDHGARSLRARDVAARHLLGLDRERAVVQQQVALGDLELVERLRDAREVSFAVDDFRRDRLVVAAPRQHTQEGLRREALDRRRPVHEVRAILDGIPDRVRARHVDRQQIEAGPEAREHRPPGVDETDRRDRVEGLRIDLPRATRVVGREQASARRGHERGVHEVARAEVRREADHAEVAVGELAGRGLVEQEVVRAEQPRLRARVAAFEAQTQHHRVAGEERSAVAVGHAADHEHEAEHVARHLPGDHLERRVVELFARAAQDRVVLGPGRRKQAPAARPTPQHRAAYATQRRQAHPIAPRDHRQHPTGLVSKVESATSNSLRALTDPTGACAGSYR